MAPPFERVTDYPDLPQPRQRMEWTKDLSRGGNFRWC